MHNLLIVDDEESIRKSVKLSLMGEPYLIVEADNIDKAYELIVQSPPDVMLLDVHFEGGVTSHTLLQKLQSQGIQIPTLILSGAASAKEAIDAIKLGAYDYLEKPATAERLRVSIARCLRSAKAKQSLDSMITRKNFYSELKGSSDALNKVKESIGLFAPKPVKILITGETGTGKEIVAKSIWSHSKLKSQPFIVVNCAAVPESLIESELFGHKKGSFTGATSNQTGKLEMASGGTVFLDEIGELSLKAQTKLLRFLENDEIQPLGSSSTIKCVTRVIAATSRDLSLEMEKGHFREDLYFRLNVGRIEIPPLRSRLDDIEELFGFFVSEACRRYEDEIPALSKGALEVLKSYSWPGNVRELKNIAERAVLYAAGEITAEVLDKVGLQKSETTAGEKTKTLGNEPFLTLKEFKTQQETAYIIKVLKSSSGAVAQAARTLGIDRSYLHQKMTQLKISKSDYLTSV